MKPASILAAGAACLFVAGCTGGGFSERASAGKENVFRYPIVTSPTSLDPAMVQDGDTIDVVQQVFEGLTEWGENNQPIPCLADRWDVSDDGKTYTFHLKRGVKFHNGREVKADDFKFSIERACRPVLMSSTVGNYLDDIVGAKDMIEGRATSIAGIKVVDEYTLSIEIDQPRPYFLGKLTYPAAFVVAKEAVAAEAELNKVEQMVGTGPFKMTNFVPEQIVELTAFDGYHRGKPPIDKIERPVIKDAATRLNKYKNGEIDLVMLERQDVAGLQRDEKYRGELKFFQRPAIWYVGMNQKEYAPFSNVKVRQAVAMAIDRNKIVNEILGGINTVANGILPPGVLGHREKTAVLPYDPEQARKLLAEAGFAGGKGMPPLTMTFREQRPDIRLVAEAVATQLKQNLGMEVSLRTEEWRAFLEKNNAKKQQFVHMRWAADYLDPQNFLSLMLSTTGNENKLWYSNPRVDELCAKADSSMDEAERIKMYAEAEDIILKDAPWVPIYFQRDAELISPKISGLRESLFGHLPHRTVQKQQN